MGTLMTGWCMTGNHDECPHVRFSHEGVWSKLVCPCECHPETDEVSERRADGA